jgi:hypothetical protein
MTGLTGLTRTRGATQEQGGTRFASKHAETACGLTRGLEDGKAKPGAARRRCRIDRGAILGLGACLFVVTQTPFFPRNPFWFAAVVCGVGAVVCGVLGYYKGDDFFRSLRDDWFG